jgi:hypothetical protein
MFGKVTVVKIAPWWWCDCTETCQSCFNVNFYLNFKIFFKTIHLCISWWIKTFDNIKMHGMYVKITFLRLVLHVCGNSFLPFCFCAAHRTWGHFQLPDSDSTRRHSS